MGAEFTSVYAHRYGSRKHAAIAEGRVSQANMASCCSRPANRVPP
jgi:hypothetical protein